MPFRTETLAVLALAVVAAGACVEHRDGLEGAQSLRVELLVPVDPGAPDNRLDLAARDIMVRISAIGPDGAVDTTFTGAIDIRAQFLGSLTPPIGEPPIRTIQLTAGVSAIESFTLPPEVFGPTLVWAEHATGAEFVFTALAATDEATALDHGLLTGDGPIRVANSGGLPAGLAAATDYWVIHVDDDRFKFATTRARAQAGTAINLTSDGAGTLRVSPSYATGTSPTLWYRDPFIADIQRPRDETALDALVSSPLEDRQVSVTASRYDDPAVCPTADCGRMIVTSIYAQGYTVSDVQCGPGGAPPCVANDYDHVLIFTFNRPRDENGCELFVGQEIDGFAGAVSEFLGLTEIGFPQTFVSGSDPLPGTTERRCAAGGNIQDYIDRGIVVPAAMPAPKQVEVMGANDWFAAGAIEFERNEAGLISVDTATLGAGFPLACPLDDEYTTFMQWELDVGRGCGTPISVITAGVVTSWVPEDHVGETLTRVVGSLRPVNGGSFNVWLIFPRSPADLVP